MIFSLNQILHKLRTNAKIYIFIILQIAIAILILNTSLILSVNSEKALQQLLDNNKNVEFYINVKGAANQEFNDNSLDEELIKSDDKEIPFSKEIIEELSEVLSDVDWKVEVNINLDVLLKDNTIQSVSVIYSTETKEVLMSKDAYEIFSNLLNVININDFPFEIQDACLVDMDGTFYPMNIEDHKDSIIYLPYDLYYQVYHPKHLINTSLSIILKDFSTDNRDILLQAQTLLSSKNSIFIYFLNNEFYDMLADFHSVTEDNRVFRFISYILLIITTIGLTGVFILIINERKKEIAIHLALGSSKKRICLECLVELTILAVIGCVLGLSSNIVYSMKNVSYINIPLRPGLYVIIVQLIIICCIVTFSMIPVVRIVAKLTPMEILRVE